MDPRFKFIRNGRFASLEDYFFSPPIKVKKTKLIYPTAIQYSFSGNEYNSQQGLKEDSGRYYEIFCQGILGGELENKEILGPQLGLFTGREEQIQPDLIYGKGKYGEVKSVAKGQTLKLLDKQMNRYSKILKNGGDSYVPEIQFEIFRHGVTKLLKRFRDKSLDELIEEISSNVRYMVSLPSSVVFSIYHGGPYTSKYFGDNWDKCSQFSSRGLNNFLAYPERTLEELDFNPKDFAIKKRRLPEGLTMNGYEIKPFPILIIKDKYHKGWLEKFKNDELQEETSVDYENIDNLPF